MLMQPVVVAIATFLMLAVSNGQFYSEGLPQRGPLTVTAAAAAAAEPNGVTSRESSTIAPPTVASGENKLFWNWTMSQRSPPSTTDDDELLPTLANGHLGFTVFGDAIYMNGLYNGHRGLSHRARIANIANIRLEGTGRPVEDSGGNQPPWTVDFETGTFCVDYRGPNNSFRVVQLIYPHQLYNRAIVNQFTIERLDGEGDIHIGIIQGITSPGSEDIAFNPTETIFISPDAEPTAMNFGNEYSVKVYQTCGTTVELEDPDHQHQQRHVCVLWNHVPEELTLKRSERTVSYKFIMTADESASQARQELNDAILTEDNELLRRHSNVWRGFWDDFDIKTEGNPTLERIIRASVFYLISNFPVGMAQSSARAYLFGGLSPTGLGRGGSNLADYEGHSFWDTEIWMFPVVNLIKSEFAEMMVDYRFRRMEAARWNAETGGYKGVRYPWESASSGVEVTQPCCPEVAQFQHHITADISFALRQYFSATQDLVWLRNQGCPMAQAIAEFWASRISPDPVTGLFDIKEVMGPDEDHENVTNNAYTNVIAAYALYFGDLTKCLCSKRDDDGSDNGADSGNKTNPTGLDKELAPPNSTSSGSENWSQLARHLKLLYDTENDYHPQFEGYQLGTAIKQADTVLLGYPLQYPGLDADTRGNDLRFYESVTRRSGPAMTWAMHAINYLDLGETVKGLGNFERSYQSYVRAPYYVWNEVERGNGATNFITGAGGFLQAVIYGFGGVRLFLDRMEIGNAKLPPESTELKVKGLQYLGAKFTLLVTSDKTSVKITRLGQDLTICIGNITCESVVLNQASLGWFATGGCHLELINTCVGTNGFTSLPKEDVTRDSSPQKSPTDLT